MDVQTLVGLVSRRRRFLPSQRSLKRLEEQLLGDADLVAVGQPVAPCWRRRTVVEVVKVRVGASPAGPGRQGAAYVRQVRVRVGPGGQGLLAAAPR